MNENTFFCFKTVLGISYLRTGSRRNTLEAAVRFNPTPPAFNDSNMTVGESVLLSLKDSITSALFLWDILPSKRTKVNPCASSGVSRMFSMEVNWEMTKLFTEESSVLSLTKKDISMSTCKRNSINNWDDVCFWQSLWQKRRISHKPLNLNAIPLKRPSYPHPQHQGAPLPTHPFQYNHGKGDSEDCALKSWSHLLYTADNTHEHNVLSPVWKENPGTQDTLHLLLNSTG